MTHIAVIGAGITGITTAYALARRGYDVSVFDRNRYAAMETSFANGGQLSASNAEVWTRWGTIFKGLKWMMKSDAPLLVNPTPSWHKLSWMAEFMGNIPDYERNTVETARLAIAAREHLLAFAKEVCADFDMEQRGILHVYRKPSEFDHARRVNDLLEKAGLERREVSAAEVQRLEPALQAETLGGFYTESDFTGDIHRYTRALSDACEKMGVTFHYKCKVTEVTHSGASVRLTWDDAGAVQTEGFDGIVVCAGVGSRAIAAELGDRVNIYPVKGYSITVNLDDVESQAAAPWVSLLDDEAKIVTSRLGRKRFRIAGTAEFNGYNLDIRNDRIRPLREWCETFFPDVSTEHCVPWAGLRPMLPSMMPKVGPGKKPGVYYNTGHGHLGWTLSAATAQATADIIDTSRMKNAA
ncbi:D-amino acid dehydrogenase [Tateyamaria sp. ANG-S1]|uniref:D-amino acid dehydrogenase n=1 Tax=Tateyamaria sp. ANG-S1 TaxID=1577905 RepID=UPI00057E299E|nr:D-amino acid dehydrogenase [Tateyamaria sp. ANG-S1]KIC50128.1 amino acid dehydrogenase [Tateyamaria sp. ANG-S1]